MITRIEIKAAYRGRCENGTIIEGDDFKSVYYACLRELRDDYGHSLYFEIGHCEFSYGAEMTIYDDSLKYPRSCYEAIRDIGELSVFSIDRKTNVIFRKR